MTKKELNIVKYKAKCFVHIIWDSLRRRKLTRQ